MGLLFGLPLSDLDFCLCVLDPCQSNPCEHGGDCIIRGNTFSCSCPAPFSGSRCQTGELTALLPSFPRLTVKPCCLHAEVIGKPLGDPGAKVMIAQAMIRHGGSRLSVVTGGICVYPAPNTVTRSSRFHSTEKTVEAKRG